MFSKLLNDCGFKIMSKTAVICIFSALNSAAKLNFFFFRLMNQVVIHFSLSFITCKSAPSILLLIL